MQLGKRLPDILIGILIIVLAVGLGSLLLTQRNRSAVTTPPSASTTTSTATIPAAPGMPAPTGPTTATSPVTTPNQPAVTSPPVQEPPAERAPATTTPPESTSGEPSTEPTTTTEPATPAQTPPTETTNSDPNAAVDAPSLQPPSVPKVDTSKPPVVTTPSPTIKTPVAPAPSTTTVPEQPASAALPRSGGAVATSEDRVPLRRDYRVGLGVFNTRAELERQTAAVSALGYTVYPIDIGSQYVAQVGPFASAADAQRAANDMARAYNGATVLAPRAQAAPATQSTPAPTNSVPAPSQNTAPAVTAPATTNLDWQVPATTKDNSAAPTAPAPAASTPAAPSSTSTAPATQRPAPKGPVYLQVGAFDRPESAQTMVNQLRGLGYEPSVQAPEGKKVTVLIGPFHGNALLRTETRLDANGFDHFRIY